MSHPQTGRLAAGCLALALGLLLPPPSRAADAEAAFKARCGDCHGVRDIRHWGAQRADPAVREAWLDRFLRRHYPPSEAERALIVRHIQEVIAATPK
jgi:hypothetical protein